MQKVNASQQEIFAGETDLLITPTGFPGATKAEWQLIVTRGHYVW